MVKTIHDKSTVHGKLNSEKNNSLQLSFQLSLRRNHSKVFSYKGVQKIRSKFTGENPCRSVISVKLLYKFIEIKLRHGFSPVHLMYIFRTCFTKNTYGALLLIFLSKATLNAVQTITCLKQLHRSGVFIVNFEQVTVWWDNCSVIVEEFAYWVCLESVKQPLRLCPLHFC